MSIVIGLLEELMLKQSQIESALNLDIVNIETSEVVRMYQAINAFVMAVHNDVNSFGQFLEPFENNYNQISSAVDSASATITAIWQQLVLIQLIYVRNVTYSYFLGGGDTYTITLTRVSPIPVTVSTMLQASLDQLNSSMFALAKANRTVFSTHLGLDSGSGGSTCAQMWAQLNTFIDNLITRIQTTKDCDATALRNMIAMMSAFSTCQTQYGVLLENMRTWIDSISLNETLPTPTSYQGILDAYEVSKTVLRSITDRYADYRLTTLQMAGELSGVLADITAEMNNVTNILNTISAEIFNIMTTFENSITATVKTLIASLNSLDQFNNNSFSTSFVRNLVILKSPRPQIDSSQVGNVMITLNKV